MTENTNNIKLCVNAVIINEIGEILVENHNKIKAYTLPGGKVDLNEHPIDALKRECYEELGIRILNFDYIFEVKTENIEYPANSNKFYNFKQIYYLINNYKGLIYNKEPHKHSQLSWIPLKDIPKLNPTSIVIKHFLDYIDVH